MSTYVLPNGVTIATDALVRRVTYDDSMLHCELQDGRIISVPLSWYPRLRHATVEQRNNWRLIGRGSGINWPMLDEDLSVRGFLAGCKSPEGIEDEDYTPLRTIEPFTDPLDYTDAAAMSYEELVYG